MPKKLSEFGETIKAPLGSLVYARSGDKGANVNVGFFFPAGQDADLKWDWLRNFLTKERLHGMAIPTSPHDFKVTVKAQS